MAQQTDVQLTTDANIIGNETAEGANTADRVRDHLVNHIDSKINNDKIDTADTLDTAGKTIPGRDAVKAYVAANIGGSFATLSGNPEDNAALLAALNNKVDIPVRTAVTLANGVTAIDWAAGDIQVLTISETKVIDSITNPVLGETIVLVLDGTFALSFSTIDAVVVGSYNAGEENLVYIYCYKVAGGAKYRISFGNSKGQTKVIQLAASDESTALTTGTGKVTFRMPHAMTLTAVRASLSTAQTGGSIFTVDINEGGSTILSTKITIDNGEKTSTTAAAAPVISDTALADDAEITVDIDQVGDGTAKGLKITLIGY